MALTQNAGEGNSSLEALRNIVDGAAVDRVFGTPIVQDGTIVLPAAKISGGAGAGSGTGSEVSGKEGKAGKEGGGSGAGLGLAATPLGVFVIRDGKVCWRPALDVNRVILGGQLVAVAALLLIRTLVQVRGRRDRAEEPGKPGAE